MGMPLRRLPPLASLRAFEAAARLSSFKAAAAELSVTPGAVSQHIRALEEDLGVKLFARSVRAVALTETGRALQPPITAAFLQIRNALEQARPRPEAPLQVESSGPIISKWLLPRLSRFAERDPDRAVVIQSVSDISEFAETGPDVILRFTRLPAPGLFTRKLCDEYMLPLASPELIERLDLREPADLVRAPLLHDTSGELFENAPDWPAWFARVGLDPSLAQRGVRFDARAADHALDAAVAGAGVVLGRRFLATTDLLEGRLVSPFGPILPMRASYFVVCREGDETRADIAAFLTWICDEISAIADLATPDETAA